MSMAKDLHCDRQFFVLKLPFLVLSISIITVAFSMRVLPHPISNTAGFSHFGFKSYLFIFNQIFVHTFLRIYQYTFS